MFDFFDRIRIPDDELIIVRAKKDFKINAHDVKEGDLFQASEKEGVIVNRSFACKLGSSIFEACFEIIS